MLSRRRFLQTTAVAGGGLLIGFNLSGCAAPPYPATVEGALQPNAFVQLTPDNRLLLQVHKADMGQGVSTGFATLVAEELGVPPASFELQFAQIHDEFKDPQMALMITGGSASMRGGFETVRKAGAALRELLLDAAAQQWSVAKTALRIDDDLTITNTKNNTTAKFADFIATARTLPVDSDPPLKDDAQFRYIGRETRRVDATAKVLGTAAFGADTQVAGALAAVVVRCPHFGGTLKSFDDTQLRQAPGIRHVLAISSGVAIVGDKYHQLRRALPLLEVEWDKGPLAGLSSDGIAQTQRELLQSAEAENVRDDGAYQPAAEDIVLDAQYTLPYLAHATMEPQNAIVSVTDTDCTVWAPNQGPDVVQDRVAAVLDRPRETVTVYNTWLGGGFGRRINVDYVVEATEISAAIKTPVKLQWSREDDMRHDVYRPGFMSSCKAVLGADGAVKSWQHKLCGASIMRQFMPTVITTAAPQWLPRKLSGAVGSWMASPDPSSVEGAKELPYAFAHIQVDYVSWDPGIPVGFWRSVGHSHTAFVVESFIDEVAHASKADPVEFRMRHLAQHPHKQRVLSLAAEKYGWGTKPQGENGRFYGVAVHESFLTHVAQIAEVSVTDGAIKVHRVVCAVDCGLAVNPDIVRAQMESGIVFGLSAALSGAITFAEGAAQQSNFHDYPVLRINECPEIEVHVVDSVQPPTGVGEPGVPPIAAAVGNAVFMATGQRLRSLPLRLA